MVIQNNNIYITRGEEATFRATIYMNDGTPFRLLKSPAGSAPHDLIYFTVKTDAFSSDDENLSDDKNLVLRYKLDLDTGKDAIKKFASYDIHELAVEPTNGHPNASDLTTITTNGKDVLYFYRDDTGKRTFYTAECETDLSVADVADVDLERYVFDITFVIPTNDTKKLFAKTYYWELDWVSTPDGTKKISKKFPLITPSQFIVRGSIYD